MNGNFEPGIMSPLSQYLHEGGNQTPTIGTPRPGTPRGSHFSRLSPEGSLTNPGTPGSVGHEYHKLPNSPWNGSEPATPGYGRNVVPSSPYVSSYPNTPATPGSQHLYQKSGNGVTINGTIVPPGSPWTERSVCTPGPLTPMTPATPIHSTIEQGNGNVNGNDSPIFADHGNHSYYSKKTPPQTHTYVNGTAISGVPQNNDSMLDFPQYNIHATSHSQSSPVMPRANDSGSSSIVLPPQSESEEVTQAVDNNPNLISEFEKFFQQWMENRVNQEQVYADGVQAQNQAQNQAQAAPRQPAPPPQPQRLNGMIDNSNNGVMYNGNSVMGMGDVNGHSPYMMKNPMSPGQMPSSVGPMRINKHHGPPQHQHHAPYTIQHNNSGKPMMNQRPVTLHYPHNPQYTNSTVPPPQMHGNMAHPNMSNMGGNMNGHIMRVQQPPPQNMYMKGNVPGDNRVSASPYGNNAPNAGVYSELAPKAEHMSAGTMYENMAIPPQNQQQQHNFRWPPQQVMNNHNNRQSTPMSNNGQMEMVNGNGSQHQHQTMTFPNNGTMSNGQYLPQSHSYFPMALNSDNVNMNNQGLMGGSDSSVLSPASLSFDLNSDMSSSLANSGPSAIPPSPSMPVGMGMQKPNGAAPPEPLMSPDLDVMGPYDGSNLSQTVWTKASDKVSRTNAVAEVGKVLFDEIFTDDEVIYCTLSGRGSTQKFNPNKVLYLKKAVGWLMARPPCPWEFNMATCDAVLNQDDESGARGLEKKVFTEYRSRRRGDILKARNQTQHMP